MLSEASKAPVGADSFGGYGGGRGSSRKGVDVRERVREKWDGTGGRKRGRDREGFRAEGKERDRDGDRAREYTEPRVEW